MGTIFKKKKNNKIVFPFYNKKEFYFNYENAIESISFHSLMNDLKKCNYYKLILTYEKKYYFVFKILIDTQNKNTFDEINDYAIGDDFNFIYPEVIMFLDKLKNECVNIYFMTRVCINIKCLFKSEIDIKKIVIITEDMYKKMLLSTSSKYTKQKMNKNTINYSDITFFLFYHNDFFPLNKIYGFMFYSTSATNLLDIDVRLKVPKIN